MVLSGGMVLWSCVGSDYDSFGGTRASFRLDKTQYVIGDTIGLALVLHGESRVRFYENIEHTMDVGMAYLGPYRKEHTVVNFKGVQAEIMESRDPGEVHTYKLAKDRPLVLNFEGYMHVTEEKDALIIVFPDLNRRFTVPRDEKAEIISLEITGSLMPVNPDPIDSLEDYVTGTKLFIKL